MIKSYQFLSVKSSQEEWTKAGYAAYCSKISRWKKCTITFVKSTNLGRDKMKEKIEYESHALLNQITNNHMVVLFDKRGRMMSSVEFTKILERAETEVGYQSLIWLVGGAFGVHKRIFDRAQKVISFGEMTFNHHVALLMALEQVYRSLTLIHGVPYHNE